MPTLTLPNDFTSTLDVTKFNDNFYDAVNSNTSFEMINGWLDEDNMDPSGWPLVVPEQTRRGALVSGDFVAGTVNLDYFNNWFVRVDTEQGEHPAVQHPDSFLPIPGANANFYVPYDEAWVCLKWQIAWTNDSTSTGKHSGLMLFVNGVPVDSEYRTVRKTCVDKTTHEGRTKARYWSGHHLLSTSRGWHTAGIRLAADSGLTQTRIWTRGFRWLTFKKG